MFQYFTPEKPLGSPETSGGVSLPVQEVSLSLHPDFTLASVTVRMAGARFIGLAAEPAPSQDRRARQAVEGHPEAAEQRWTCGAQEAHLSAQARPADAHEGQFQKRALQGVAQD